MKTVEFCVRINLQLPDDCSMVDTLFLDIPMETVKVQRFTKDGKCETVEGAKKIEYETMGVDQLD